MSDRREATHLWGLEYLKQGWRLLPCWNVRENGQCECSEQCTSPGKHPRIAWKQTRGTNRREIFEAWLDKWPNMNLAITTDGLAVVDIDTAKPATEAREAREAGAVALARLEDKHGVFPPTITQRTGGGGEQRIFSANGTPCGNTQDNSALGEGLDVRGEGGLIVVPPSVHASGMAYTWVEGHEPGTELAECPSWFAQLVPFVKKEKAKAAPHKQSRHEQLRTQTLLNLRVGHSPDEVLARARSSEPGKSIVAEGRDAEIVRLVEGATKLSTDFNHTDTGNAQRFVQDHTNLARYCHKWKEWLIWDGTAWKPNDTLAVLELAKATVRGMIDQASEMREGSARKDLLGFVVKCEARRRMVDFIELAKSDPQVATTIDKLNQHPMLLNVANGTLNLETFELGPHDPDHLHTYCLDVPLVEANPESRWLQFLDQVFIDTDGKPDRDLIAFMQRSIGYSLTSSTSEQCWWLHYGEGGNGKSTFIETIAAMMGDTLAHTPDFNLFLKSRSRGEDTKRRSLILLRGRRFISALETTVRQALDDGILKMLTGSDRISGAALFHMAESFEMEGKIHLGMNELPAVEDNSHATWRRVRAVPYNAKFEGSNRDLDIKAALHAELDQVLAWAVQGCRDWQANGLGTCAAVTEATDEYRASEDVLAEFVADECTVDPEVTTTKKELFNDYLNWAGETNIKYPMKPRTFNALIKNRTGIKEYRSLSARGWTGIARASCKNIQNKGNCSD